MSKHAATVSSREGLVLLGAVSLALIASAVSPFDRITWVMEVIPALIVAPVLVFTRERFPLTRLLYWLIALHALILIYGGAYTYARVPLGFWMEDLFGFTRNHYDRIGHFAQGFIPAIAAREILLRTSPLRRGKWLFFLVSATCLAISAVYEFIEWWAALISAQAAEAFLGTQGDPWDTQWDMFLATLGAITAQILLARLHDRQLATLSA
ncbi:MAG: DUF2238 domain-containing protein [Chrysiogenetes bacterium]|nr:DUF2238 domain-containing protein [Chrysiogenetes bacterium]